MAKIHVLVRAMNIAVNVQKLTFVSVPCAFLSPAKLLKKHMTQKLCTCTCFIPRLFVKEEEQPRYYTNYNVVHNV